MFMCSIYSTYPILIDRSSGINHNVDELLVGILTQLRLKRQKAAQEKSTTNKVTINFSLYIWQKRSQSLYIWGPKTTFLFIFDESGDGLSGEVCESWAGQVLQQPEHLVNICFFHLHRRSFKTPSWSTEKRGWPSQVPQPTLRSDFQVSWRVWLGWPRGNLNIFWTRIGSKYL